MSEPVTQRGEGTPPRLALEWRGASPLRLTWRARLSRALLDPVDASSLVVFRIAFGVILAWECWRYFSHGWITRYWVDRRMHFKYWGFEWVEPWSGDFMYLHVAAVGVLALLIAVGLFYRVATALFFVGFTYLFLLDQATYLNHFYLICLLSLLLVFVPAQRAFSLDARLFPSRAAPVVPGWSLWLLRAQLVIVYFYAGVAKLNGDWLVGEPLRRWLADSTSLPVIGPWLTVEWVVMGMTYGGLLLDLLVGPALLFRPTRAYAFVVAVVFHLMNAALFKIGIFPWFMIAATTLFLAADWPKVVLDKAREHFGPGPMPSSSTSEGGSALRPRLVVGQRWVLTLVSVWIAVQLAVPLRHFLYPGTVHWTEEGHRFAWHMKLRDKVAEARFFVTHPSTGETEEVPLRKHLTRRQLGKMSTRPDMILQFAHFVASKYRRGEGPVEVRAHVRASLNGRPYQPFIDPSLDLAVVRRSLAPAGWILPLAPGARPGTMGPRSNEEEEDDEGPQDRGPAPEQDEAPLVPEAAAPEVAAAPADDAR